MMAKRLGYFRTASMANSFESGSLALGGSAPGPHRLDPWRRLLAPRSTAADDVAGTAHPFPTDESGHRRSTPGVSFRAEGIQLPRMRRSLKSADSGIALGFDRLVMLCTAAGVTSNGRSVRRSSPLPAC